MIDIRMWDEKMNYDLIIARYGEIGIKSSKVRARFERKLVKNIKATFECKVDRNQGRIYIRPKDFDEGMDKLNKVFGVVSYSPAVSAQTTYDEIDNVLTSYAEELISENILDENTKFAIKCRRVGKHDFSSQEMAAHCGNVATGVIQLHDITINKHEYNHRNKDEDMEFKNRYKDYKSRYKVPKKNKENTEISKQMFDYLM